MKKLMNNDLNNRSHFLMKPHDICRKLYFLLALATLILVSPELLAIKDSTDTGLNASAKTLVGILDNTLIPVILVAGCIASIVYSFAIAQPKPFILSLATLCGFGFARAWISGTYALIG